MICNTKPVNRLAEVFSESRHSQTLGYKVGITVYTYGQLFTIDGLRALTIL